MITFSSAFSVPIATAHLESPEGLNSQLRALFLERSRESDQYANASPFTHRNRELFESRFDLFDWPETCVQELRTFCVATLYKCVGQFNGYDPGTLRRLEMGSSSWFHLTRSGGYFGIHNHPMASWSGVYMVCQEGDEAVSESGLLTLVNPLAQFQMYVDPTNTQFRQPFATGNLTFRLKPGQLLLFPSWLMHEVTPFLPQAEGLRITVAFNCWFRMAGS